MPFCIAAIAGIGGILYHDHRKMKEAQEKQKVREEIDNDLVNNVLLPMPPEDLGEEIVSATYGSAAFELEQLDDEALPHYRQNVHSAIEIQKATLKKDLADKLNERDKCANTVKFMLTKKLDPFLDKVENAYYARFRVECIEALMSEFSNISVSVDCGDDQYLADMSYKEEVARLIRKKDRFESNMFLLRRELGIALMNEREMYKYFRCCDNAIDPNGKEEGFYRLEEFLMGNVDEEPFTSLFGEANELLGKLATAMGDFFEAMLLHGEAKDKLKKFQEQIEEHQKELDSWNL